ncbi:MAG: hypothetical protein Q8904_15255, partial [Bacteroidota bacterium]|nr:hypothetical protein [Bacteroidota bacterium]
MLLYTFQKDRRAQKKQCLISIGRVGVNDFKQTSGVGQTMKLLYTTEYFQLYLFSFLICWGERSLIDEISRYKKTPEELL